MKHSVAVQACSVATRSGTPLLLHCPPHADSVQPISSVDATQEYAVLQLILGVRVADVPVGFEDVLGRVTDDFPDRVGDMFLDWHHRRCVVCVRYAVEGSSHTMESCTSDLASAIVQDSAVSVCDVGDACRYGRSACTVYSLIRAC